MSAESGRGLLCIRATCFDFEPGAAPGTQRYQVQDALSIRRTAVADNPNLGLEPLSELYHSASRPQVEAAPVADLHAW